MVGLISVIGRRPVAGIPSGFDHLQRLEQAAGFSMVAFENEDDLCGQPSSHAGLLQGENAPVTEDEEAAAPRVTGRVASLIDDCAAVVTSYLRPAF